MATTKDALIANFQALESFSSLFFTSDGPTTRFPRSCRTKLLLRIWMAANTSRSRSAWSMCILAYQTARSLAINPKRLRFCMVDSIAWVSELMDTSESCEPISL